MPSLRLGRTSILRALAAVAIGLALTSPAGAAPAAAPVPTASSLASRPSLVVVLVVDQMRADYVDRFGHQWRHGLRRLVQGGAWWRRAAYPYLGTVTCPGHATIATGAFPWRHGMILNAWWDREAGQVVTCTDDATVSLVPTLAGARVGHSARSLLVPTLADELRLQLAPAARVVSFSMKARAAISLAGHGGDVVTWFEKPSWVTSTAFSRASLPWLERHMAQHPASLEPWTKLLPEQAYLFDDDAPEERPPTGWQRTFPHALEAKDAAGAPSLDLWEQSPAADRALGEMAQAAVRELGLGRGGALDYLAISFSALDRVGHAYGPRSHEVQDVLARLDQTIGDLLAELDRRVGKGRYVVALSADHGVAPYPEQTALAGVDAGRVPMDMVTKKLDAAIARVLGPGKYVVSVQYTDVYLAKGVYERLRRQSGAVEAALSALRTVPGVQAAYDADALTAGPGGHDDLRAAAARSHYPGRSGDFVIVPRPHWITVGAGTTHGSHHDYDARVPLVLYGAGIRPGVYLRRVSPADLAPTLAFLAGVTLPAAEGQVLDEALSLAPATAKR